MMVIRMIIGFGIAATAISYSSGNVGRLKRNYDYLINHDQNNDTQLLAELKSINKHFFIGKEVASFLRNSTIAKYKERTFINEPPGVLSALSLKYSDKIYIEIEVKKYVYLKQFNEKMQWDFNLYKKEKISEIRLIVDDKCVEMVK